MTIEPSRNGKREKRPRRWAPRMWLGCGLGPWVRLLARNRFAVGWQYSYIAAIDTIGAAVNAGLYGFQQLRFGRQVNATELVAPPVFIIGHWRSGTTLLHELLVRDPEHTFPNTYECFSPNHFLVSEDFVRRWFSWVMPEKRPMDNMVTGWERPQEDEFALCNMGQPSPYLDIAFPNRNGPVARHLDPDQFTPAERESWKAALSWFLKCVTLRTPKRIVLKSPPHTSRVKLLAEAFPKACFVNIVRNPYELFASTVNLWRVFYAAHGLQKPKCEGLEEYVFNTFTLMHEKLEQARRTVDPAQIYDLRYEDLVADPMGEVRAVYEHFGWDFDRVRPGVEEYMASVSDYRRNRYDLAHHEKAAVARRWAAYFHRYGYTIKDDAPASLVQ